MCPAPLMRGVSRSSRYAGWDAVAACGVRSPDAHETSVFDRSCAESDDDHIVRGRPKARYPGASPCAMRQRQGSLLVQRERGGAEVLSSGDYRRVGHQGFSRSKPFQPLRAERRIKRRDRGDLLVRLFSLRMRLRMRSRIRRSARPHVEGGANRSFGRPRAVTTTGVIARGCLKTESECGDCVRRCNPFSRRPGAGRDP